MRSFTVVAFAALLAAVAALPAQVHKDPRSQFEKSMLVDDIRFPPGFNRSGIIGGQYRWPDRTVIFEIDGAFNGDERNTIYAGLEMIRSRTCVQFRERTWEPDWVFIQKGGSGTGCWSYGGKIGGRQILNLQAPDCPNCGHCIWVGTAAHEMIHAIGFFHEQSRYDRDDHVIINWGNIPGDVAYNFNAMSTSEIDAFGVPYDHGSIMHYDAYAFAINPNEPTIIARNGAWLGGDQVTGFDSQKIGRMYGC